MNVKVVLGVALAAVVLMVALIIGGGVYLYRAFKSSSQVLSQTVDELLTAANNGTFEQTYRTHTTLKFRDVTSLEEYRQLGEAIRTRLGRLQSKKLTGLYFRQFNATRYADASYQARFEKGPATIHVRFRKRGDKWLVETFRVQSPRLRPELPGGTCPACGKDYPKGAKFCPSCGQALPSEDESAKGKAERARDSGEPPTESHEASPAPASGDSSDKGH